MNEPTLMWGLSVPTPNDNPNSYGSNTRSCQENEDCFWVVLDEKSELGYNRQIPLSEWRASESD